MKINIQSPHFEIIGDLMNFVTRKINKLDRFHDRILKAEVCLKFDKSDTDNDKVCEIKLIAPEKHLFASRKRLTFEEAVTETVKALEQQIIKKKTKWEGNNEKLSIPEEESETEE